MTHTTIPYFTRRTNLVHLIGSLDGGNVAAFARRINRSSTYVIRLCYPPDKPGAKRLGEELALEITQALGLEYGALDTPIK